MLQLRRVPSEYKAKTRKTLELKKNCRGMLLLEVLLQRTSCMESKVCIFKTSWFSKSIK